ncbi:MAG: RNA pseudouridine synthase, partial [Bacilli bacterium]|nr:RNA pseudouridine synthase [Bacilli bacterium]
MKKMNIIYEDKEILVVDKEPHLLTIATEKRESRTLYNEASTYVKKQYPKNKIFIVHRLDKETSGLVIFAKNPDQKLVLQNNWSNVKREYLCIVEGKMPKKKDTIKSYLIETKTFDVYETKDKSRGKLAITEYEVLQTNNKYSLLKINIKTGRRNQIRVQLSSLGNPIVGDKKYGSKTDPLKRLGLHANLIEYKLKGRNYHFETKYPIV